MAINNSISVVFTDEELKQADEHLYGLEKLLVGKCQSLKPEQRSEYSRLGNRTENWSKKVMNYMQTQPGFNPSFVDTKEAENDYSARQALMPRFNRLSAIFDLVDDTLMILGSDIYQSSIAYYRNVKMLADQNVNGAKTIYDDLAAQFPGRPSGASVTDKTNIANK